jgi:glycosyltransferase involved in cell wall biosynthesis
MSINVRFEEAVRILLVNTSDVAGGAEGSSRRLLDALQERGHNSWLAVGKKRSTHEKILRIPNDDYRSPWAKLIYKSIASQNGESLAPHIVSLLRIAAEPRRWIERQLGIEDFNYPGTPSLTKLIPKPSLDVVHLFNLHGDYFDLRQLPKLSRQVPTIFNPRDAWPLSGHCAHSFECNRWKIGCGHCPNLTIYPLAKRDATAYNWKRKKRIFSQSHLYVVTPSRWLMEKVEQSVLADAVVKSRVIPTGVDLSLFYPMDKKKIRAKFNLPLDSKIVLFAANSVQGNAWKDYKTARSAIELTMKRLTSQKIVFIALRDKQPSEHVGSSEIRFLPFVQDRNIIADYYRVADICLHVAKADTFPNTVLESLACGTPVIGTNIGGIPEQIKGFGNSAPNNYGIEKATGILVGLENVDELADAIINLLTDQPLRSHLSENAAKDCRQRFDFNQQVDRFIDWYHETVVDWKAAFGEH